jgi:BirA family biotin operon repressor/biotin-[acetyl-CoA-carboxylase] ligase
MPYCLDPPRPDLGCSLSPNTPEWDVLMGCGDLSCGDHRITLLASCSSALDVAWALLGTNELNPWDSVLCGRQWAGRGQMRRLWRSPLGNLYGAVSLPPLSRPWAPLMPILVAYGICQGLRIPGLRIKWPNDLLWHGAKVGGILIEERGNVLVAGIGLNVSWAPHPAALRAQAATLAGTLPISPPIAPLWGQLVQALRLCYETLPTRLSPSDFCSHVEPWLAWLGQWVQVEDHRSSICGILRGVTQDGALCLACPSGEETRVIAGQLRFVCGNSDS